MLSNFAKARERMVVEQLVRRGISDPKVLVAMATVPREEFVPEALKSRAYEDGPLPIGEGQTISQPYIVALMTELLEVGEGDKVLEIGTGSGYQAAVLASIGCQVIGLEFRPNLAREAKETLAKLGLGDKVQVRQTDGRSGWPKGAPYDGVLVTAACPRVEEAWLRQLRDGGHLVLPLGSGLLQELTRITKKSGEVIKEGFGGVRFVPLV